MAHEMVPRTPHGTAREATDERVDRAERARRAEGATAEETKLEVVQEHAREWRSPGEEAAPGTIALWFAFLGGPTAVLAVQQLLYTGAPWGCIHGTRVWMHGMAVLALAFIALAGVVGWRCWVDAGARPLREGWRVDDPRTPPGGRIAGTTPEDADPEGADALARARFMAAVGIAASAFSALIVIAMWIPVFFLNPCVRT